MAPRREVKAVAIEALENTSVISVLLGAVGGIDAPITACPQASEPCFATCINLTPPGTCDVSCNYRTCLEASCINAAICEVSCCRVGTEGL